MKKRIINTLLIMIGVLILGGCGNNKIKGRYLQTLNGDYLVSKSAGVIELNNHSGKDNLFEGIGNGDKIEISMDAILETWPGQTNVYKCRLIKDGAIDDIDYDVLTSLEQMGRKPILHNYKINEDGTYTAENGITYKYLKRLTGRMNNSVVDGYFDILTNNESITYDKIAWSLVSSQISDIIDQDELLILWMGVINE